MCAAANPIQGARPRIEKDESERVPAFMCTLAAKLVLPRPRDPESKGLWNGITLKGSSYRLRNRAIDTLPSIRTPTNETSGQVIPPTWLLRHVSERFPVRSA